MMDQSLSDESKRNIAASPGDQSQPQTQTSLFRNYLSLFRDFRRTDLNAFCETHDDLYRVAKQTYDHLAVTKHYYSLMASVIATYYGEGWHFCPPEFPGQSRHDATIAMYRRIADTLELKQGQLSLDIGCGVGGMMRFLSNETGATITGITLGANETSEANELANAQGVSELCEVIQGDSQQMPFENDSFDSAFAVYALKYYPSLDKVFAEIFRVMKPNGKFSAYCLCKSRNYSGGNPEHVKLLSAFEYSTAMPSLHSVESMICAAESAGLVCIGEEDISNGEMNWYSYWTSNPVLPWLVKSRLIYGLTRIAESVRILPSGFTEFNDKFLAGTLRHIIEGGRSGVLTGSALLTFQKK